MNKENTLRLEAGLSAIEAHESIIDALKDIITLSYGRFKIVDLQGVEIKKLQTIDFSLTNIKNKEAQILANQEDIKTCYAQMELFKKT